MILFANGEARDGRREVHNIISMISSGSRRKKSLTLTILLTALLFGVLVGLCTTTTTTVAATHDHDDSSDDSSDDEDEHTVPDFYCIQHNPDGTCQHTSEYQHFTHPTTHQLEIKNFATCLPTYPGILGTNDEIGVAQESSLYQQITFAENLVVNDKCLWLDNTMQQCLSYRPHYHEPFVHLSAAYTDVKRVVFVGGGDSMLLHEVLKYPSLELVLGLELDQKVTRNSFEHFKTQPHFDNDKVQWWFGDGAKSLTLLPREYFGTFDLVLLDLSETVRV
jgi:hypothetical protein